MTENLKLSICVVAFNEESFLPNLLSDLKNQKYPHHLTEIVLIDSMSTDKTRQIMEIFRDENKDFYSVQVLENPKKIQASGWNVAIKNATGDVISRIDAHTKIPAEFSELVMKDIAEGEKVVGGIRPCVIENNTDWGRTLLNVENSLFGSSINSSRHSQKKSYVNTMFHASYCREVFDKVGLFNEKLLRTEDNEMHFRIRQAGYKLCYDPEIISYQYARSSLKRMIKQKFSNGVWIGKTLFICPKCLSVYHFIPFVFVIGIIVTTILSILGKWQLGCLMWSLYLLFSIYSEIVSVLNKKANCYIILMPIIFLMLHTSYGIGTLLGILRSLNKTDTCMN